SDRPAAAGEAAVLDAWHLTLVALRGRGGAGDRSRAGACRIRSGHARVARHVAPALALLHGIGVGAASARRDTAAVAAHRALLALIVAGARRVGNARRAADVAMEAVAAVLVVSAESALGALAVGAEATGRALLVAGAT